MRSLPVFLSLGLLLALACGGGAEEAPELPGRGVQVRLEEGEAEEQAAEELVAEAVEEAAVEEAVVEEAAVEEPAVAEVAVEEAAVEEPAVAEVAEAPAAAVAAPAPAAAESRGPRRRPAKAEAETVATRGAPAPAADAPEPEPAGAVDHDAAEALLGDADGAGGLGLTGTGQGGGGSGTAPGIGAVVGRGAGSPAGGDDAFDWLASLPDSAIQYNRPEEVPYEGSFQVGLVIDISGDHAAAGEALYELRTDHPEMVGRTMAVDAPTGDEVEVTLLGSNAKIEPLEPERQRVSRRQPARWRWRITPEAPADIELNLSVMAIEPGRQNGLKIESYSDTIHVRVTAPQRAKLWLADNWEWAWTFLGAPVFALGWSRVQRRRRAREAAPAGTEPTEG